MRTGCRESTSSSHLEPGERPRRAIDEAHLVPRTATTMYRAFLGHLRSSQDSDTRDGSCRGRRRGEARAAVQEMRACGWTDGTDASHDSVADAVDPPRRHRRRLGTATPCCARLV